MLHKYRNQFLSESSRTVPNWNWNWNLIVRHQDPQVPITITISFSYVMGETQNSEALTWPTRPDTPDRITIGGYIFRPTGHAHVLFRGFGICAVCGVRGVVCGGKDRSGFGVRLLAPTDRMKVVNGSTDQRICLPQAMCQMPSLGTCHVGEECGKKKERKGYQLAAEELNTLVFMHFFLFRFK